MEPEVLAALIASVVAACSAFIGLVLGRRGERNHWLRQQRFDACCEMIAASQSLLDAARHGKRLERTVPHGVSVHDLDAGLDAYVMKAAEAGTAMSMARARIGLLGPERLVPYADHLMAMAVDVFTDEATPVHLGEAQNQFIDAARAHFGARS